MIARKDINFITIRLLPPFFRKRAGLHSVRIRKSNGI